MMKNKLEFSHAVLMKFSFALCTIIDKGVDHESINSRRR